uniref:Uncharacterized protein n=1 Tax=viral metagenome TaxID=1070528 RepID=A0A6C0BNV7_9ZZZZ
MNPNTRLTLISSTCTLLAYTMINLTTYHEFRRELTKHDNEIYEAKIDIRTLEHERYKSK